MVVALQGVQERVDPEPGLAKNLPVVEKTTDHGHRSENVVPNLKKVMTPAAAILNPKLHFPNNFVTVVSVAARKLLIDVLQDLRRSVVLGWSLLTGSGSY